MSPGIVIVSAYVLLWSSVVRAQSIVTCSCDLTQSACDANCCCDSDCSSADVNTFVCSTNTFNEDSRLCVNELIFVNNLPQSAVVTDNGVFCIIRQSDTSVNFYTEPTILNTSEQFDSTAAQYPTFSYELSTPTTISASTFYVAGDTVDIQYSNGLRGSLVLPIAGAASGCLDSNPASFLNDQSSSCARRFSTLSARCSSGTFLDPLSYFSPDVFTIAQFPFTNTSASLSLVNITVCDGSTPAAISFASGSCFNAVSGVSYVLRYNSTAGISAACVTLTQTTLAATTTSLIQSFSISYVAADTVLSAASPRSGNPGYVIGKPLRTSRLVQGNRTLDTTVLTLLTPSDRSLCTGVTNTQIRFGEDSRTGCRLSYDSTQTCADLYNSTQGLLNIPTSEVFVANYGNTSVNSTDANDWLEIAVNLNFPSQPSTTTTVSDDRGCEGMLVGIHYDVFFANTGSLSNPQPEIIGIRYSGISATVKYECFGIDCITGTTSQFVEITSSVTFTDASSTPSSILRQRPIVDARLPSDFFFPFSGSST